MTAPPRVLVLNLGWEQHPLVAALRARQCTLYGVHATADVPDGPWADVLVADMRDLTQIAAFADRVRPDAVISDECDYAYFAQAFVAERHHLPGPRLPAALHATNKYLQRQVAHQAGIPVPDHRLCLSAEDARRFGDQIGWPIIVKPVDNRGSFGVTRVADAQQTGEAFERALVQSHSRLVLAERYIAGDHVTIDGYCEPGRGARTLAIGANRKFSDNDGLVNESILYPAPLPAERRAALWRLAEHTADTLGYRFGPFHGEFMVESGTGRVFLTEMANRGGGVHISNIALPYLTGLDLVNRHIDDALGLAESISLSTASVPRSVLLRFVADTSKAGSRLLRVLGAEEVRRDPSVLCLQMFVRPGDVLPPLASGAARHAMIIVAGDDPAGLEAAAARALAPLAFEVAPAEPKLPQEGP